MSDSIEARVASGATWLDEHRPGWERMIDLGQLDMPSASWCICGQAQAWSICKLSGETATRLGFFHSLSDDVYVWESAEHRAHNEAVDREYEALDAAWRPLIKERFNTGALSDQT